MKKLLLILIVALLSSTIIPNVFSASVKGTVYNLELEPVKNALVEIRAPKQFMVAADGSYTFSLTNGTYHIKASYNDETAEDNITVADDGEYVLDLILFPSTEEPPDDNISLETPLPPSYNLPVIIAIGGIILLLTSWIYLRKRSKSAVDSLDVEDNKGVKDIEACYEIIKKEKRITQKELRKRIPYSEAKVSLMISELESKGKIKKLKRGRGNIIIAT